MDVDFTRGFRYNRIIERRRGHDRTGNHATAKMYMDKLANGINPLNDAPVPEWETLNNVRLCRCFFYASDVLRRVIENGGTVGRTVRTPKAPFAYV